MVKFIKHIPVFFVFMLVLISCKSVFAQDTNRIKLPETTILENRYSSDATGHKKRTMDSLLKNQFDGYSLSDLFSLTTACFVKSYGVNGIATTSVRGASASHSIINWNGFNINNPMLGQSDLSILPVFFFNDISILYGGQTAANGSAAVSASVFLKNVSHFSSGTHLKLFTDLSSMGNNRNGLAIEVSKKRWLSNTKLMFNQGKNNFTYLDTSQGSKRISKQQHNSLKQIGLLHENQFLIGKFQKLTLHLWLQNSERELPPILSTKISKQNQSDGFMRSTLQWQHIKENHSFYLRAAYFDETINYTDSIANLFSKSRSVQQLVEGDFCFKLSKQISLTNGFNTSIQQAKYNATVRVLHRHAVFTSVKIKNQRGNLIFKSDLRQEYIPSRNLMPFSWNVGIDWMLFNNIKLFFNGGKVFRLPTLNDWFWVPGGNPDLKPETGYCEEAGFRFQKTSDKISFSTSASFYNRNITNWIMWLPQNGNLWTPTNLLKVNSYGIENETELSLTQKRNKYVFMFNTNYGVSSNQKQINEFDASIGKQLIYTPMYMGSGTFIYSLNCFSWFYSLSYTGYRYTSSDNFEFLAPYWLHHIGINFSPCKRNLNFFMKCSNLFNTNYQVVRNYATPLRNYNFGIQIKFNKPLQNNR